VESTETGGLVLQAEDGEEVIRTGEISTRAENAGRVPAGNKIGRVEGHIPDASRAIDG